MKVLDASFLIDYDDGVAEVKDYLLNHPDEEFLIPSVILTGFLLGDVHSRGPTDLPAMRQNVSWGDVYAIDEQTAVTAAEVADDIGPQGPQLNAIDALVAAVAREVGGTVVSNDRHLTHPEIKKVVDVDEYR
jgi:predicted nucleic acid-binding protein